MLNRVAVLADIHGNLPALEAVLAEADVRSADLVVLNGDLADGPFPAETIARLDTLGTRALWLRGNGDRWLAESRAGHFRHSDPATDALIRWAAGRLTPAQSDRLAALPLFAAIDVAGIGPVGLCHATGRSDNEMFLVDSAIAHAGPAFERLDAPVIVVGHCHMPFDRLFDRRRIVNAGSVGLAYGHAGASWALMGPDIVLRRTLYDAHAAAGRILASGMPGAAEFVAACVLSTASDAEALASFHATRARQQEHGCFD